MSISSAPRCGPHVPVGAQGVRWPGRASAHCCWSSRRARGSMVPPCSSGRCNSAAGQESRPSGAGTVATHQVVGMGLAFELARAPRLESERPDDGQGIAGAAVAGISAPLGGRSCCRHGRRGALGAASELAQCVLRGGQRERVCSLPAVRGRLAVSTGSACTSALQELLLTCCRGCSLGPRRRVEREQHLRDLRPGPLYPRARHRGRHRGGHPGRVAPATIERRVNYNEATLRYFETAPGAGVFGGPGTFLRRRSAAVRTGPGCNSTCS